MGPSFCGCRKSGAFLSNEMRADLIVITNVILRHETQLRFVEHDQVIEAFAPNRSDEAFDVAILPG